MRRPGTVMLAVAMLMAMTVSSAQGAGGGPPIFQQNFDDISVEAPDQFVSEVCGVGVVTVFHVWGHVTVYADMTERLHFNRETVSTAGEDPATGKVLLIQSRAANVYSGVPVQVVDEQAGTLTATSEEIVRGLSSKWNIPGEGVILLNAGSITVTTTTVWDLVAGHLLSTDVTFSDLHGPHPSLTQSDGDEIAMFCEAMRA